MYTKLKVQAFILKILVFDCIISVYPYIILLIMSTDFEWFENYLDMYAYLKAYLNIEIRLFIQMTHSNSIYTASSKAGYRRSGVMLSRIFFKMFEILPYFIIEYNNCLIGASEWRKWYTGIHKL